MKSEFESNLRGLARRMLLVRGIEAAGFCAIASGLVSVGVVWVFSWFADIGIISLLPLVMMLIGAFTGAMRVLLRGESLVQVARFLDSRYTLRQHLSTGAELLETSPDSDISACVYNKALADLRFLPPGINFWILTRRTGFALLLTIAMCGLLAVSVLGAKNKNVKLSKMPAIKRAELERAYRDAAALEQNFRKREHLLSAADAIKINDESRFDRIVQQLRREGFKLSMGQVSSGAPGSDGAGSGESPSGVKDPNIKGSGTDEALSTNAANANGEEFRVLVYDPVYSRDASDSPDFQLRSGLRSVPLQSAWADACERAASNLRDGKVPTEYRKIIRAFFTNNGFREQSLLKPGVK